MVSRYTGERARNGVSEGVVVVERTPRDGERRGNAKLWRQTPGASSAPAGARGEVEECPRRVMCPRV